MKMTPNTVDELLERFYRLYAPVMPINEETTPEAVDFLLNDWNQALASLTDADVQAAARLYVMTGKRFPTPADLLRCHDTIRAVQFALGGGEAC